MGMSFSKAKSLLSTAFVENHQDVAEDEAADEIVRAYQELQKIEDAMEADANLNAAKNVAKDLGAGYKSAMKYEKAKISFFLGKIKEIQEGTVNPTSGLNEEK